MFMAEQAALEQLASKAQPEILDQRAQLVLRDKRVQPESLARKAAKDPQDFWVRREKTVQQVELEKQEKREMSVREVISGHQVHLEARDRKAQLVTLVTADNVDHGDHLVWKESTECREKREAREMLVPVVIKDSKVARVHVVIADFLAASA